MIVHADPRPFVINVTMDFGPRKEDAKVLKKYANLKDGRYITRDILVPGDISLSALHFTIQRAFGFMDNHLNRFYLADEDFHAITKSKMKNYRKLIGIIFKLQDAEDPDIFWNEGEDDVAADIDDEKWMRSKYTGPYKYTGYSELPENALKEYKALAQYYKKSTGKKLLDAEFNERCLIDDLFESCFNDLMSRLPLNALLAPKGKKPDYSHMRPEFIIDEENELYPTLSRPVTDKLLFEYDFGDGWQFEITRYSDYAISDKDYRYVVESYRPRVLYAEGSNLIEDVGGTYSFASFLCEYFIEKDKETIEWAGEWSAVLPPLEEML